ncbi:MULTISPECIES: HlyD family efflux transporter periplasmic adaptor subunit [Dehalobacter]|uniref:HlyD family efflux transporter periplasmic adaptor subunit n=2 Tax=Dehalobacter restrictus TaxID=55583 RepID=A0A857DJK8_9FIRM|nr:MULTISPECIES: HlyD family efflux transporter periplasmic adaptor subunit [Dehalobacter]AHF09948.1 RND transporter [Dehalobacter restrictus DSM 9455]MCG1026240.1 HlyD family efflux transporter periplasmic adaptor subunit [Dehalobacter sp.]MDJ0304539.1 HlyD family efflux transporter periplasmic adaptor subunit [Dehalobacter sp.]OCZ53289.1 RND transporter [Dehalobacter sp. TeCB1]QHA00545.1 HlyD family efflux transporter periplasmic adaptor subunit [Dehalobacter restrictus]
MKTKRKSKIRKWMIYSLITLVVISVASAYLLRPKPFSYDSVTAQKGDITTNYTFSGNIETQNRQTVMSEKIMQVSKLNFQEGDTVKKGDILLKTTTGEAIKAKINGEITNLTAEEGSQVMAGTMLMDIVDYDNLQISIKVDEYDLPAIKTGNEANIEIAAIQKKLKGTICSISREGTVAGGVTYFTAAVDINKDPSLRIGMTAEVTIQNQKAVGVVTLPMSVIQFDANNTPFVFKEGERNAVVHTEITTGVNDGQTVEIKKGVAVGETIYYPKTTTANNLTFGGRMQGGQINDGNP